MHSTCLPPSQYICIFLDYLTFNLWVVLGDDFDVVVLKIPGSAVVYLIGEYNSMGSDMKERVKGLFSKGIAPAASVSDAVIVDGGLSSNISAAETTPEVMPLSSVLGVSRCEGMYGVNPNLCTFHDHHVVVRCSNKHIWKARLR